MTDNLVKCTRCKHIHKESERVWKKKKDGWSDLVCPKCSGKSTINADPSNALPATIKYPRK